jgi:hypothetical protein
MGGCHNEGRNKERKKEREKEIDKNSIRRVLEESEKIFGAPKYALGLRVFGMKQRKYRYFDGTDSCEIIYTFKRRIGGTKLALSASRKFI